MRRATYTLTVIAIDIASAEKVYFLDSVRVIGHTNYEKGGLVYCNRDRNVRLPCD